MRIFNVPQGAFSLSVLKLNDSFDGFMNECIMKGYSDTNCVKTVEAHIVAKGENSTPDNSCRIFVVLTSGADSQRRFVQIKLSDAWVYNNTYSLIRLKFEVRSQEVHLTSVCKQCLNIVEQIPKHNIEIGKVVSEDIFNEYYDTNLTLYKCAYAFYTPEIVPCVCVLSAAGEKTSISRGGVIQNLVSPSKSALFNVLSFGRNKVQNVYVSDRKFSNNKNNVATAIGSIDDHAEGYCDEDPFKALFPLLEEIAESRDELGSKVDLRFGIVLISDNTRSFKFNPSGYCLRRQMLGVNVYSIYSIESGIDKTISNCSSIDEFKIKMNLN